jgi:hypothetical protein
VLAELLDHRNLNVTRAYYRNPQELHQEGEKPQVSRSKDCRNSVLLVPMPAL